LKAAKQIYYLHTVVKCFSHVYVFSMEKAKEDQRHNTDYPWQSKHDLLSTYDMEPLSRGCSLGKSDVQIRSSLHNLPQLREDMHSRFSPVCPHSLCMCHAGHFPHDVLSGWFWCIFKHSFKVLSKHQLHVAHCFQGHYQPLFYLPLYIRFRPGDRKQVQVMVM
jgi:hypothetical protein